MPSGAAETKTPSDPAPIAAPKAATATASRAATSATIISEVLGQNLIVDPGKSVRISAKADFSGAERASFGVYAEPTVNITKIRVSIWWGVASLQLYSVQDIIRGSSFPYTNAGGSTVPVCGSALFIDVANDGDAPFTVAQLMVYAVAR